ncbi:SocA family protein [Patescibacteria group bacterium]|nr:SocA family protein [Patescibacteria group bacterium]
MIISVCKKGVQAINYFARKKDGRINKMKALKLIYFADRYHLRKYGRPVVGDTYWAMKLGPVGSNSLDVANLSENSLGQNCLKYAREYLTRPKEDIKLEEIISKKEVLLEVFSESDIEALENAYKEFGDKDQFELAKTAHEYPEWSKFKKEIIDEGKKRMRMDYIDFFKNPRKSNSNIFDVPEDHLDTTKEIYLENKEVANILN